MIARLRGRTITTTSPTRHLVDGTASAAVVANGADPEVQSIAGGVGIAESVRSQSFLDDGRHGAMFALGARLDEHPCPRREAGEEPVALDTCGACRVIVATAVPPGHWATHTRRSMRSAYRTPHRVLGIASRDDQAVPADQRARVPLAPSPSTRWLRPVRELDRGRSAATPSARSPAR